MVNILSDTKTVANQYIYELRHKDIQKDRRRFRNNMKRLGTAMAIKISENLEYQSTAVETPLGTLQIELPRESPVLITILRAGGPFLDGFLEVFDGSDVGFIGAFRLENGTTPGLEMNYKALPETTGKDVILLDPMLATGHSMSDAIRMIASNGEPRKFYLAAAVAAPEGIDYLKSSVKLPFEIWTGALDEKLNSSAYIVPGLGDAGDLSYGPKI